LNEATAQAIRPGQILVVPERSAATPAVAILIGETDTPEPQRYTIRRGDTLYAIAQRFQVSVDAIAAANGLTAADMRRLRPGQSIVIPTQSLPTATPNR
jgi:peptidoglycan-N-acetylglucosamine deacetylase